ncbi:MAG: histidine kinase [Mucinivorans sp.]
MVLIILLFIAIGIQITAMGVALGLVRVTKYNSSWILFIIALLLMSLQSIERFVDALNIKYSLGLELNLPPYIDSWLSVATSLCMAIGVFMIKKALSYITLREQQRRTNEKRILTAVIQAEERQRQKLSKELHDGLGPLLSTAKMSISALSSYECDAQQREILLTAENVIDISLRSVRNVSNLLSPHILNNFGLARAITKHIRSLETVSNITIDFKHNITDKRFNAEHEIVIFRVVSELINNTMRHSAASHITLNISNTQGTMIVEYADNGHGFDMSQQTEGMGLSNIFSRVSTIGGQIDITSRLGGGMHANVRINNF